MFNAQMCWSLNQRTRIHHQPLSSVADDVLKDINTIEFLFSWVKCNNYIPFFTESKTLVHKACNGILNILIEYIKWELTYITTTPAQATEYVGFFLHCQPLAMVRKQKGMSCLLSLFKLEFEKPSFWETRRFLQVWSETRSVRINII